MRKKALSGVIIVILLVILVIAMIFILWIFVKSFMIKQTEISEIKTELLNIQIDIHKADITPDNKLVLTLSRGGGEFRIKNITKIIKKADIVFVVDSTASMGAEISDVNSAIQNFTAKLIEDEIDYRLALVEYKDYPSSPCGYSDDFPNKTYNFSVGQFTSNVTEFRNALPRIAYGGGDEPESHLTALENAANLPLRPGDVFKFIIMLTDAPPHAEECFRYGYPNNTLHNYTGANLTCYLGPTSVQTVTNLLVSKRAIFYYINKLNTNFGTGGLCDYPDPIVNGMVPATGGKAYDYNESGGVEGIILQLASQIITEYEKENYDHVKVLLYNATGNCERKIPFPPQWIAPPAPLETRTYNITLDSECISNATKIELYPVILASDGTPVIGQLMDSINLKN